jgi:DNA-binding NtrC family response regulator
MGSLGVDIGNVRALHPLRVLVAARDRQFVNVAGFLLARGGFHVQSTGRPRDVVSLVGTHDVDVVLLDGSESLSEAARLAGVLEALHPHVTVVVVADDGSEPPADSMRIFSKWNSLSELVMNLERMHLGGAA